MLRDKKTVFPWENILIGSTIPNGQLWNHIHTSNIIQIEKVLYMYLYECIDTH